MFFTYIYLTCSFIFMCFLITLMCSYTLNIYQIKLTTSNYLKVLRKKKGKMWDFGPFSVDPDPPTIIGLVFMTTMLEMLIWHVSCNIFRHASNHTCVHQGPRVLASDWSVVVNPTLSFVEVRASLISTCTESTVRHLLEELQSVLWSQPVNTGVIEMILIKVIFGF